MWSAPQPRDVLQCLGASVDHDDLGLRQGAQGLDADVPEPAGPEDDGPGAGHGQRQRLAYRTVGAQAGVPERSNVDRGQTAFKRHDRSSICLDVLCEAARSEQAREHPAAAVHVLACAAGLAVTAGRERVQQYRVTDGDVGHA